MTAPPENEPTRETEDDPEENRGIPAAYTYLGQFIDHDLTFDPTSQLRATLNKKQLQALVDFRTPRFDLDDLYGRGPDEQPYMYKRHGIRMLMGEPMPTILRPGRTTFPWGRTAGRSSAIRNDENRIVRAAARHLPAVPQQGRPSLRRKGASLGRPRAGPMALPVGPGQRLPGTILKRRCTERLP
jgi:hypothetical protein